MTLFIRLWPKKLLQPTIKVIMKWQTSLRLDFIDKELIGAWREGEMFKNGLVKIRDIHSQMPNIVFDNCFISLDFFVRMQWPFPDLFSSSSSTFSPRVHPRLHLSTTTMRVWACGPQETWPCSHTLLVISFTTEFRQGPGACALSSQWLDHGRKGAWLAMLAMWMSTRGRVRDQLVSQYQTVASLFGNCDGKERCRLLH